MAVDDSNLTALADEDEGYIEMDSSVTEYIEDLTLHVVVESSPLSVTAKHQLKGNEDRDSSASPRKRPNRPLEMPVPELSTVSEPVLPLDPCLSVADFHPEYEYVDDQLISQPLLMSSQHTSTSNTQSAQLTTSQQRVQPVTAQLTTSQQRVQPVTAQLTTSQQRVQPVTAQLTTSQQRVQPVTAQLTTSQQRVQPVTAQLTTTQPARQQSLQPATLVQIPSDNVSLYHRLNNILLIIKSIICIYTYIYTCY